MFESPPNFADFDTDRKKRVTIIKEGYSASSSNTSELSSASSAKRIKLDPDAATSSTESMPSEDAAFGRPKSEHTRMSLLTGHDGSPDAGDHLSPFLDAVDSVMTHCIDAQNVRLSMSGDSGEPAKSRLYSVTPPPPSGVLALSTLSSPIGIVLARAVSVESSDSEFLFLGEDDVPDTPTPKGHTHVHSVFGKGLENTPPKTRTQKLTPLISGMHHAPNPLLQFGGAMYDENTPISKSLGKHPQCDFA